MEKEKKQLESIWIEKGRRGEGRGVEGNRVKLVKNRLILDQIYFTLFYSPSLPFNPNGPLIF